MHEKLANRRFETTTEIFDQCKTQSAGKKGSWALNQLDVT